MILFGALSAGTKTYLLCRSDRQAFTSAFCNTLPVGCLKFSQPGEEHDDQRRRATDRIWSKKTYRLKEIVEDSGNRVMYYLSDGPERAFESEELMLIPEDTELPPDYIQEW